MADINAKFVRILAPGGVTLNFTGITGNSHKAVAMPVTLIKKALDRGAKVYELIEEKDEDENVTGYSEVELTLENYTADNGGKEVTASNNVVPDIEKDLAELHAAEFQERLEQKGLEIKERQDELAEYTLFSIGSESSVSIGGDPATSLGGGGGNESLYGGDPATSLGGGGNESLDGGEGSTNP